MEKITKSDVNKAKHVINNNSRQDIILKNGRISEMQISGGVLKEVNGGVYYYGNDGSSCFFKGVSITDKLVMGGAAYQLNGLIHVSPSWANNGFNVYDFAHEYGHYLQQEEMGEKKYYEAAMYSVYSIATDPENHLNQPFEKEATQLGNEYLKAHYQH